MKFLHPSQTVQGKCSQLSCDPEKQTEDYLDLSILTSDNANTDALESTDFPGDCHNNDGSSLDSESGAFAGGLKIKEIFLN